MDPSLKSWHTTTCVLYAVLDDNNSPFSLAAWFTLKRNVNTHKMQTLKKIKSNFSFLQNGKKVKTVWQRKTEIELLCSFDQSALNNSNAMAAMRHIVHRKLPHINNINTLQVYLILSLIWTKAIRQPFVPSYHCGTVIFNIYYGLLKRGQYWGIEISDSSVINEADCTFFKV